MIRRIRKALWDDRSIHYKNAVIGGPCSVLLVALSMGPVDGLIAGAIWIPCVVMLARIDPWLYPLEDDGDLSS